MRFPILSVITWTPFVGALLIMFTARHSPLAVRLIAAVTTGISTVLSLGLYVAYDREAALSTGFQFYEKVPLVPPLGINYELAVDGISLLMVLLTSIIIFTGVFASWTVATRSQEFYALLLACINVVYGALSAMAQVDLKYVIAYSSVSHMGLVMLGAATLTEAGLNGSVFQMFAHGVMTGLFFALVVELGTGALMLVVFAVGLFGPTRDRRVVGIVATAGVFALGVVAMVLT